MLSVALLYNLGTEKYADIRFLVSTGLKILLSCVTTPCIIIRVLRRKVCD